MNHAKGNNPIGSIGAARKAFLAFFAALLAVLALAPQANAQAVISPEPPRPPQEVVVFPQRDFVVADGYTDGQRLDFKVIRKDTGGHDVTVGTASGIVAGGLLEVNHPGGVCWTGQTPDILPGDRVVVTDASGNGGTVTTANVTAEKAFINETTGNIEVHGTARAADGGRLPIERIEQRIINPDLGDTTVGRRDIRATSDGAELGTISYNDGENGTGTRWTATYSDLGDEAEQVAIAGQTRVLGWQATNAAGDRLGITIFEEDEIGGPGMGGCAAGATNGITDFGRDAINAGNIGQSLVVSGSSFNASAVSVSLTDGTKAIQGQITEAPAPAADPANPVSQTWKATFTEGDIRSLSDGMLTASTNYTIQTMDESTGTPVPVERTLKGADRQIEKDLVRPAAPTATPGGGQSDTWQSVELRRPAGEPQTSEVHYTTNGNQPSIASRVFGENILVTDDQAIRAITVDRAGNESPVAPFNYDIQIGQNSIVEPPANVTPVDFAERASNGITNPPQMPHEPVVFPQRDFVSAEGYEPFQNMFVKVIRNGHVVGTAQGTTDATGFIEVNHPGGVCWNGQTPDIQPGDRVVVSDTQGSGDAVETADVFATGAEIVGDTVVVQGTAKQADGQPFPLERLEQRIINPAFRETAGSTIDRRDIRATSDGAGLGTISYDTQNNPDGTKWTAVYSGLNAVERQLAIEGQTRVLGWQATNAAGDRLGITIFEEDEINGPGFGGCPQATDFAATGANRDAVNLSNEGEPLEIHGIVANADYPVSVKLTDDQGVSIPADNVALSSATSGQVWKATFSAAAVDGLDRGALKASPSYTVPAQTDPLTGQVTSPEATVRGIEYEILKDTQAPLAAGLTATPNGQADAPTEYGSWQAITLEHSDDPSTEIHFTLDGSNPTPYSRLAGSQIVLDQREQPHALKAIAVDSAGNRSDVGTFNYRITDGIPPRQPGAPDLAAASDTGSSDSDNLTNDATATFTGTAEAGSTVRVLSNGNEVGSGTATGGSYSIDANLTTEGPQDITVTATDAAGNTSGASAPLSVNFDRSAPAAPTANPAAGDHAAAQQVSLSVAETGARIFYTTNGSEPTASSTPFTATSAPISVSRSTLIRAISVDDAGNTNLASFNYRINAFAPTVTNTRPLNVNTRDRTPVIRATVLDRDRALGLSDITLRVDGVTINDNLITYNASTGALSYTPRRALALGPVPVSVTVTDSPRPSVLKNWRFSIVR